MGHYLNVNPAAVRLLAQPDGNPVLAATLATGPDATPLCPGGTQGVHSGGPGGGSQPPLPPMRVSPQTDGVNRSRVVSVAMYCRPVSGCQGTATLTSTGRGASNGRLGVFGSRAFNLRGNKTGHVAIRVASSLINMLRKHRGGLPATLTIVFGGTTITQTVGLRIF